MKFENIYKEAEENLQLALLSLWAPGCHPMQEAIKDLFKREPLLAEPIFQSTFGWEKVTNEEWKKYLHPDIINKLNVQTPYSHQAHSWRALYEGKSIAVTSGTGSGKTECFMYPVIDDLCEQNKNVKQNAIEAIFLYPLNALMDDQKERLSKYCKATDLHFAVYNGDTDEFRYNGGRGEILENEIVTRNEIRNGSNETGCRPEILLTNPSMLEYILVRESDRPMIEASKGKLRWIIIDEAHTYAGSAAIELAFQIKRILDAFGQKPENVRFACTSATIGSEDDNSSLREFISTITGLPNDNNHIKIIGGKRLVPQLDEAILKEQLIRQNLPSIDIVLSVRNEVNQESGMSLQQMWGRLMPTKPYDIISALQLLDNLCELNVEGRAVLSLRAHFFMRTINGLYGCANPNCRGKNPSDPLYGHLTTRKSQFCPECGLPLLEIVQCKKCGNFILMGNSDSISHKISACEDLLVDEDYFSVDNDDDEEDNIDADYVDPNTFYIAPYKVENFFNPIEDGNPVFCNIEQHGTESIMQQCSTTGQWVSIIKSGNNRGDTPKHYCPTCGKLARGSKLNFKHFRIPISFINQTISPVFLKESARENQAWGKYIAFTDSRQGTAISAKTYNISTERIQCHKEVVSKLAQLGQNRVDIPKELLDLLTEEQKIRLLQNINIPQLSLHDFSETIYNDVIFQHISNESHSPTEIDAYKAALIRSTIGRRPITETNAETLGLFTLVYPNLNNISMPDSLVKYKQLHSDIMINNSDWHDFLKLTLDYFVRTGNHIQPLVDYEIKYIRENNKSTPFSAPDNNCRDIKCWPMVYCDKTGAPSKKQSRIVTLLCAGLGIHTQDSLQQNANEVNCILRDAFKDLSTNILKKVSPNDTIGYNNPRLGGKYIGCYYLDLSNDSANKVCIIRQTKSAWLCPVTNKLLDTVFCGYSPLIEGAFSENMFRKYICTEKIEMPQRPCDEERVDSWLNEDGNVRNLKKLGLWNDRYKYVYKKTPPYLAAEHSAQQSKAKLRIYLKKFIPEYPTINVLHCSTTMEMGVDLGDIDIVVMDTIPPTAANYMQRAGRAGRQSQTKSLAFSLCNNTPIGQNAFNNPMWALETINRMPKIIPSQIIIQRHINSYLFRKFVWKELQGIKVSLSIDDFFTNYCDSFIQYLQQISTNEHEESSFRQVFGDIPYSVSTTINAISDIKNKYKVVISELEEAYKNANDARKQTAINYQINKIQTQGLIKYLSEHQFIPNANMPIGVVTFDFINSDAVSKITELRNTIDKAKQKLQSETDDRQRDILKQSIAKNRDIISEILRNSTASRDIRTALNEYAPGQTVVVDEKNYVSAGITLIGDYNEQTQQRYICHCRNCGHTEYREGVVAGNNCPICNKPFHGIIDKLNSVFTLAYEPIGFRTDVIANDNREEDTQKKYYDIRTVLLNSDWTNPSRSVNLCERIQSNNDANILFYNVGNGHGFAFCKKCGRAMIEVSTGGDIPKELKSGHNSLWGGSCIANDNDIARNVVFTGKHPTCYVVMRFKDDANSNLYVNDEQLIYSLGVVICRALTKYLGVNEDEISFGVQEERETNNQNMAYVLYIYDTAKGGCGYSLRLMDDSIFNSILAIAKQDLEQSSCRCHIDGGACTGCLIDRNTYRFALKLSKSKVLNWLSVQSKYNQPIPELIKKICPSAKVIYQSLKNILQKAMYDPEIGRISLFVSDLNGDVSIMDWKSVRQEIGRDINQAVLNGKKVSIYVEYHEDRHTSIESQLPFANLKDYFPDCTINFINDMGDVKTAMVLYPINPSDGVKRYFTDKPILSFSCNWGENCDYIYVDTDEKSIQYEPQKAPAITLTRNQIIRQGLTKATSFNIRNYFTKAIAASILSDEDINLMRTVLQGQDVYITFSDMYVNSALAGLMFVYLIDELRQELKFNIKSIILQFDSYKRNCHNDRYTPFSYIGFDFPNKEAADNYTYGLIKSVLGIEATPSGEDADHYRWIRIHTKDGGRVEIRPDHGISGGWKSDSQYKNLENLDGNVIAIRNDDNILYYVIIENNFGKADNPQCQKGNQSRLLDIKNANSVVHQVEESKIQLQNESNSYNREYTSDHITTLQANEIFVFGSNLAGQHIAGAAQTAHKCFGAIWGQGEGMQGQCYAIPTMQGGVNTIKPYVDNFIAYAKANPQYEFLVTRIGCGVAGFKDADIAPLFKTAMPVANILLPKSFVDVLENNK